MSRWVIIVLSFHHILGGIRDDLFRIAAGMVGGVGPFDHGVSFQFFVQHFEISLPSFSFDKYRHISTYYPIPRIYQFSLESWPLSQRVQ